MKLLTLILGLATSHAGTIERRYNGWFAVWTNHPMSIRISGSVDAKTWFPWMEMRFFYALGSPCNIEIKLDERDKMQFWKLEEIQ